MRKYSTRNEAIEQEIVQPIEAGGEIGNAYDNYDIDAIAEKVLAGYEQGYKLHVTVDEFWTIVEEHELPKRLTSTELLTTRHILGLSGQELANRLNVRPDTIQNWENGRRSVPHRVREELAEIASSRARDLTLLARALESDLDLPLTPETVVETKGWRGTLHDVQVWLWDGNHILEANLLARLREEGRIPAIDTEDDDAIEGDATSFLTVLPKLSLKDLQDLLDDPQARILR